MPSNWKFRKFSDFLTPRNEKSNDCTLKLFAVTDKGIIPRDEKFNKRLSKQTTYNKVCYDSDLIFGMSRKY